MENRTITLPGQDRFNPDVLRFEVGLDNRRGGIRWVTVSMKDRLYVKFDAIKSVRPSNSSLIDVDLSLLFGNSDRSVREYSVREDGLQNSLHRLSLRSLAQKAELIDSLYVEDIAEKPLVYSIILKDDTFDNWESVYGALFMIEDLLGTEDEVRFRFYPLSLKESLSDQQKIEL